MQQQITRAQQAFYLGLALMLSMALLSLVKGTTDGPLVPTLTVMGAMIALGARLWQSHLQRLLRERDSAPGLDWFR